MYLQSLAHSEDDCSQGLELPTQVGNLFLADKSRTFRLRVEETGDREGRGMFVW